MRAECSRDFEERGAYTDKLDQVIATQAYQFVGAGNLGVVGSNPRPMLQVHC